ncbi:hypothetical protein RI543_002586 [Arxiozyma heterogenica]|uniref:Amino acid permease/ SLC12A domain-containing protein n=1 Tax=Arxiozyma heterogenica TaxID=278026 RepID=A0AAN7ZXW8_9SACH|nr:hypothetical protein RI543_002586 [Kazachstania heterogenica]
MLKDIKSEISIRLNKNKDELIIENEEKEEEEEEEEDPRQPNKKIHKKSIKSILLPNSFIKSFKKRNSNNDLEKNSDELEHIIKQRHTVMISLGTGIGTGLLVGTGKVLSQSGPLGLMIGYIVSSIMVYLIIQSAGELGVVYCRMVGNFTRYPSLLVDPAFGFAISIIYTFQWITVLPLQLVTAAMVVEWWEVSINLDWFVLIIFLCVILINLGGAKGYVEAEFIFNICKILMICGFIILGIIIIAGGVGTSGYLGNKYWKDPGLFANGFKGVSVVFCYAAFSYGGVETVILTAAEQKNPEISIPRATKVIIIRILLIYLLTLVIICFLVPYNDPKLMGSVSSSMANSSLYAAPRLLLSLSQEGILPKTLQYIDQRGRPLICFTIVIIFGCLGFVATSDKREEVFIWLLSVSGLSQIFIWMSMCASHIRFRYILHEQKRLFMVSEQQILEYDRYKSKTDVWGSIIALLISILILGCQFWVALFPIDGENGVDLKNFCQNYLAGPIVIVTYIGYKIYLRQWQLFIPIEDVVLPDIKA